MTRDGADIGTEAKCGKIIIKHNLSVIGKESMGTLGHFVLPSVREGGQFKTPFPYSYQVSGFVVSWSNRYGFSGILSSGVSGFVFIKLELKNEIRDLGATYLLP